jgi:hypothetical protein
VVQWTGPPDAEEPASVVEVVPSSTAEQGAQSGETGSGHQGTATGAGTDTLTATGGTNPLVYAGLWVGALALSALSALLARRLIRS